MDEMNYKTLNDAKNYYKMLARDFCMDKWVFKKIDAAKTIPDLEHIWWGALNTI